MSPIVMDQGARADDRGDDPRILAVQSARSFLFVPGDRSDRFGKAAVSGADVIIIDLEDAVGVEQKASARQSTATWLRSGGRACVRVNPADSLEHEEDLAAVSGAPGLVSVILPKSSDPAIVSSTARRTGAPVVALVESAAGLLASAEIAMAPGVARLAFGHLDYAVDLHSDGGRTAMLHARSNLVLVSRAAGLPGPIDGVTVALDDPDVLNDDLAYARDLGLTGKLLIHPSQVEATHAAYRPSRAEMDWAERVINAVRPTPAGAIRVDGAMVDSPVIKRAEEILRRRDR